MPFSPLVAGHRAMKISRSSGPANRQRSNIPGVVGLATRQTRGIEAETIDATSAIRLLASIEAFYPMLVRIHVFVDDVCSATPRSRRNGWLSRDDA
jgi:hypothetical protein